MNAVLSLCGCADTLAPLHLTFAYTISIFFTGSLVSHATVRLLQPECECSKQWAEEPQLKQATRIVNILFSESVPQNSEETYNEETATNLYPAANFAFIFYFLNCVLVNCGEAVGKDENVIAMAIKVIGQHAQIRLEKGDFERKVGLSLDFKIFRFDYSLHSWSGMPDLFFLEIAY